MDKVFYGRNELQPSDICDIPFALTSNHSTMHTSFIPQRGDYRKLIAFQKSTCIYDITYYFAKTFLDKKDRTVDLMVQAARSGKPSHPSHFLLLSSKKHPNPWQSAIKSLPLQPLKLI